MKITIAFIAVVAATLASVSAFAPTAVFISRSPSASRTVVVFSSEPEKEEEGLDLNLEEMFDMFDAADKDESFDEAIKKVKGE